MHKGHIVKKLPRDFGDSSESAVQNFRYKFVRKVSNWKTILSIG